ncbi:hypothetical protein ACFUJR_03900 [Streptomyces sp. NPDC057271]|uniref:hypothetical protein n=1 Tax=unclassified Streptomyces TaxID=2593676 RepID=UPI00363DE9A3
MGEVLPSVGGAVPLIYLPERPHISDRWPIHFFGIRACVAVVFVPALALTGLWLALTGVLFIADFFG